MNHKAACRDREYLASCAKCRRERQAWLAHVAKLIRKEVSASDEACNLAAQKILNYLRKPR